MLSTFLQDLLPPHVPIISVSKGLELGTGSMMSELIPQALGRRHPAAFLSGPSFAKEVMDKQPTGFVAASKVSPLLSRRKVAENQGTTSMSQLYSGIRCLQLMIQALLPYHNYHSIKVLDKG